MATASDKPGHKAAFGILDSKPQVEGAVEMLKNAGFRSSDISVLMPTRKAQKILCTKKRRRLLKESQRVLQQV